MPQEYGSKEQPWREVQIGVGIFFHCEVTVPEGTRFQGLLRVDDKKYGEGRITVKISSPDELEIFRKFFNEPTDVETEGFYKDRVTIIPMTTSGGQEVVIRYAKVQVSDRKRLSNLQTQEIQTLKLQGDYAASAESLAGTIERVLGYNWSITPVKAGKSKPAKSS